MGIAESPSFRLTVWRPVRWNHEYLDVKEGKPVDFDSFQESVYSWESSESPFDGIEDAEKTEKIRSALIEDFAPGVSHKLRQVEALERIMVLLDDIMQSRASSWTDSGQEKELPGHESSKVCIKQHRLLALCMRLQWIYDTFRHVPGATLTFR